MVATGSVDDIRGGLRWRRVEFDGDHDPTRAAVSQIDPNGTVEELRPGSGRPSRISVLTYDADAVARYVLETGRTPGSTCENRRSPRLSTRSPASESNDEKDVRLRPHQYRRTHPAALVPLPLAIFPTLLYVTIGLRQSGDRSLIMLGYCAFAILGTMMFQFGVGVATSRNEPWSIYVQTLPGRASERLAAMLISGVAFSATFCLPVIVTALGLVADNAHALTERRARRLCFIFGAVSLGLLGLALGYWLPASWSCGYREPRVLPALVSPAASSALSTTACWRRSTRIPTGAWMDPCMPPLSV